jgi:hypothetical protein
LADQERHAIEALTEVLMPLLTRPIRESADDKAPADIAPSTGDA